MAEDNRANMAHILLLPYPSQGHINPLLNLAKRLAFKGAKTTLATTVFISKSFNSHTPSRNGLLQFETVSDGFDEGGFSQAESIELYLQHLQAAGSKSLAELIKRYSVSGHQIDCIIYDAFLPWAVDVAKKFGLKSAAFFTQPCCVNYVYYLAHNGLLKVPGDSSSLVKIPGMPEMVLPDMPSFVAVAGSYPAYFELVLNQFSNLEKADSILVNTFCKLEPEIVKLMSGIYPTLTIGPAIPSMFLDNRVPKDDDYDLLLTTSDPNDCRDWLSTKPKGSVIYVSFGSMAVLSEEQMHEIAFALKSLSSNYFLWVVRECEEPKLPQTFAQETSRKGLLVRWSQQLEVLANEAVGCFFTHCGWNSTIEALSLGVPMVGMPLWTDQPTNGKFVEDVWQVGKRVKVDDTGVVTREEIQSCITEVMNRKELKENALKWKEMAKEAVSDGGDSDRSVDEFLSTLSNPY